MMLRCGRRTPDLGALAAQPPLPHLAVTPKEKILVVALPAAGTLALETAPSWPPPAQQLREIEKGLTCHVHDSVIFESF